MNAIAISIKEKLINRYRRVLYQRFHVTNFDILEDAAKLYINICVMYDIILISKALLFDGKIDNNKSLDFLKDIGDISSYKSTIIILVDEGAFFSSKFGKYSFSNLCYIKQNGSEKDKENEIREIVFYKCLTYDSLAKSMHKKIKLLFVHGWRSSNTAWKTMELRLNESGLTNHAIELDFFPYYTFSFCPLRLFKLFIPRRYVGITQLSQMLLQHVKGYEEADYFILAHSMGTLITLEMLIRNRNEVSILPKRVSLMASPKEGSRLAGLLSHIYFRNPQLRDLSPNSNFIASLRDRLRDIKIGDYARIQIVAPYQDMVVNWKTLVGSLNERDIVFAEADHSTILQPASISTPPFPGLVRFLRGEK